MTSQIAFAFPEILGIVHPWLLGMIFFALILASGECGFRLGAGSRVKDYEDTKRQINSIAAAVLGVLGLLLGFSLVMSVSRFDARRLLVVDEANAIGTMYLDSELIPPPEGPELVRLVHEYTDAKLHFFDAGADPGRLQASRARTEQLQQELWSQAAASARRDPRSIPTGLLLQSLTHAFDTATSRWIALTVRVPNVVLWVDILVGLLAVLLAGYNFGLAGHRNAISMCLLAACVATVMAVIIDLDQPLHGLIRVGQQPLIDLQRQMEGK
jgi:hypothetical protein